MALQIITEKYYRPFVIGRGRAFEMVQWSAWRDGRPRIRGYAMSEQVAINDLKQNVQPDWTGELDGLQHKRGTSESDIICPSEWRTDRL